MTNDSMKQPQRGFSGFKPLSESPTLSNEVERVFIKVKNSVRASIIRETEAELVFEYSGVGIIMYADDLITQTGKVKSLFVDAEVCSPENPQIVNAMVGMLRANYFMTRYSEIPMFFCLRDSAEGNEGAFCLAMRMNIDQALEFDWAELFERLNEDIHKFREAVRK
jgi:hypothetical protein